MSLEEYNEKVLKMHWSPEQLALAEEYCQNDMSKLKATCYPIFKKNIGGIDKWEYDDLYSWGLHVLCESIDKYKNDQDCKFHTYLTNNLKLRYYTYLRNKNRDKRSNVKKDKNGKKTIFLKNESYDAIKQNGQARKECLGSGSTVDDILEERFSSLYMSENVEEYLSHLSRKQRQIVLLLANKYDRKMIIEELHISVKEYNEHMAWIRSDCNTRFLYKKRKGD